MKTPEPPQAGPCQYCWGNHQDESCPLVKLGDVFDAVIDGEKEGENEST